MSCFRSLQPTCESNDDGLSNVLVIYAGGTIGMIHDNDKGLIPSKQLKTRIYNDTTMNDLEYINKCVKPSDRTFVLPKSGEKGKRIFYRFIEFENPIDSSNVSLKDWSMLAVTIEKNYSKYDGFVILHGTDTLSHTASALSFMLENLQKPVILTGSQIPLFSLRSDGRDNFITSIFIAGNFMIPEVTVFFHEELYRGNRVVKDSTNRMGAFTSYNFAPLATAGINIEINTRLIMKANKRETFKAHQTMNENVGLLRIFPTISASIVRAMLQPPVEGIVIQTYGAGNIPANRKDFLEALREANERGVILVSCSQCPEGPIMPIYETGKIFKSIGVLSGYDITPEAALTKLAFVLAQNHLNIEEKKKMMMMNLRGEMTLPKADPRQTTLCDVVAEAIGVADLQRYNSEIHSAIQYTLLSTAIMNNDLPLLETLKTVVNVDCEDGFKRTAMHTAAFMGNTRAIELLLACNASLNTLDRLGVTPLMEAVTNNDLKTINCLKDHGASVFISQEQLAANIHRTTKRIDVINIGVPPAE